ncbi:thiol:disulfide interchange protein DsbA/DsbL [Thalassotalea sp. PLHSN55]|uniref:thiol:disulfide interchange protein DsbA/DsbL n=1 Tax=Thalassotalea sp. PLHSN55 TaxID=3435888 RepID=UPI003F87DBBC
MKKFISLMVIMMMPLFVQAAPYTEGKQYTKVSEVQSKKPEVREYFSFYCPHCRSFEPLVAQVKKQLPEGVTFEYNHVDFLRGASPQIQQLLSKGLVVAQQLGMEKKLMTAMFNYIQVQRASITSEKDLRNVFVLNGADGEEVDKLMKSFSVNNKAKSMKRHQEKLTKTRAITGVPTIVVNGKYRINNGALDRKNVEQDLNNLVQHLLTLD